MSEPLYYYSRDRQTREGPTPLSALRELARQGTLRQEHLVWTDGMGEWAPAATVPGIFGPPVPPPIPEMPPTTPGAVGGFGPRPIYAGFWLRFLAAFVDGLVLMIPGWVVNAVAAGVTGVSMWGAAPPQNLGAFFAYLGVTMVSSMVLQWVYFAAMESSVHQATLGKMALGLRVTGMHGERISFGKASSRYFGKILSGLILEVGYIMAAFTERKQALHDILAECLVVRAR